MTDPHGPSPTDDRRATNTKILKAFGWVAGGLILIVLLGAMFGEDADPEANSAPAAESAATEEATAVSPEAPTDAASEKPSGTPEPNLTPKQQVEADLADSGISHPRVLWNRPERGYVTVKFRVGDNLTDGFIRLGIADDVFSAAEAFRDSGVKYDRLLFEGTFPLVDKYGNESQGTVFRTQLKRSTVNKINYDNVTVTDWEGLEQLAGAPVGLHPDFRG
jgi:hypothetical protein